MLIKLQHNTMIAYLLPFKYCVDEVLEKLLSTNTALQKIILRILM